jgi:hypothetical protein
MFARFLPRLRPRLIDRTFRISRPLGSTATPASSDFTATTGRSASERRIGTQCLRCLPLAGSLSRPWRPTTPVAASTLAFSRSVQEPQTRLTPPSRRAPPGQSSGHPPGSSRENSQTPRFRCHLDYANDASTAHPHPGPPERGFLARLPGPHLTRPSAPSPCRSPRRSSANAAQGGLTPPPEGRRRRANKPPSPAQHRLYEDRLHQSSFSVRDARLSHKLGPSGRARSIPGWARTSSKVGVSRGFCCRRT